jgi:GNAT superfamily N-acetyltransferase
MSASLEIIEYTPAYRSAFSDLNKEWISKYFVMEETDYKALDHPDTYIIDKGGYILVALYNHEPLGVCALVKMNDPDYDYELSKMAVSPAAQGKKIGWKLAQAIIDKARTLGAKKLYLESNTILEPAINLYRKLGFTEVAGRQSSYDRANIKMELVL